MAADKKQMGELHEEFLAALIGGRKAKASGATWTDKTDGRNNHLTTAFAFAFDGKSTRGVGITVTREMLGKLTEEADAERPLLGLRFYDNDRLDEIGFDWVALPANQLAELLYTARLHEAGISPGPDPVREAEQHQALYERPQQPATGPEPYLPPEMPPRWMWPCALVNVFHLADGSVQKQAFNIDPIGRMIPWLSVGEIRVESNINAPERLMVNGVIQRAADLRVDGQLRLRVHPVMPLAPH